MYYVEFLRVFRALRVYAIVLAAVFLIFAAVRLGAGPSMHRQFMQNFSPTAVRTVSNQNGVETVTIVDREKQTRVVQHTGPEGWDMTIYEGPGSPHHHRARHHRNPGQGGGLIEVHETDRPDGTHVTQLRTDRRYPFDILATLAGLIAAIFATVIGASLSRENDGHLELVWTKPSSREQSAVAMFAVDAAGILASFALCALLIHACIALFVGWPVLTFGPNSGVTFAIALLFPLAWYALTQGLSASLGRSGRMICGIIWVPALLIPSLLFIDNPLVRGVLRTVDTLNPVAYFGVHTGGEYSPTLLPHTPLVNLTALAAITILAIAASLVQWRRLEA